MFVTYFFEVKRGTGACGDLQEEYRKYGAKDFTLRAPRESVLQLKTWVFGGTHEAVCSLDYLLITFTVNAQN